MDNVQLDLAKFNEIFSDNYFSVLEVAPKKRMSKPGKIITTRKLKGKGKSTKSAVNQATA